MSPVDEFETLLEICRLQVAEDPSGVTANPHLYGLLHQIYLRLCHGNIPEHTLDVSAGPPLKTGETMHEGEVDMYEHEHETEDQHEFTADLEQLLAAARIVHARNLADDDDFDLDWYRMIGSPGAKQNVKAIKAEYQELTRSLCGFHPGMITQQYCRIACREEAESEAGENVDYLG